jgi:hypothetical protein
MKTLRYFALLGAVLITSIFTAQAIAQEDSAPEAEMAAEDSASASALEEDVADNQGSDYKERLALAKEMHEIRPAADQVDSAIESVSLKMPEASRESFKSRMRNSLDYRAIERISINAMAVTYTLAELEAMVEYYSTPEAKSALDKTSVYQQKVGPEIVRMIDRAVMQMRTGGAD